MKRPDVIFEENPRDMAINILMRNGLGKFQPLLDEKGRAFDLSPEIYDRRWHRHEDCAAHFMRVADNFRKLFS